MPEPATLFDALLEAARLRAERNRLRNRVWKLKQERDRWRERAVAAERAFWRRPR